MATQGMSDNDLVKLASKYYESKYAVPEKTTWDYIQEDIDEWHSAVKARSAKFMQDLPEEFDLNKIEPQGREAVGAWFKDMRREYMDAANKAALFDPGSFAYGDGTSKMNKIEDSMDAVSGIFDNVKKVRTESIANDGKTATRVDKNQQAIIDATVSGEIFDNMKISTDGSVTFTIPSYIDPETNKPKILTEDDIQTLPVKGYKSESAYNAVVVGAQEFKQNGIAYENQSMAIRKGIVDALNSGRETGEQMDLMFDVAGADPADPKPYVTKWLEENPNHEKYKTLSDIKQNMSDFYNEYEQDFIDNFLMPNTKAVYDAAKLGEKARRDLEAFNNKQDFVKSQTAKNLENKNKKNNQTTEFLEKQGTQANQIIADGGSNWTYSGFDVTLNDGVYTIKKGTTVKVVESEAEMRNFIGLDGDESIVKNDPTIVKSKSGFEVPLIPIEKVSGRNKADALSLFYRDLSDEFEFRNDIANSVVVKHLGTGEEMKLNTWNIGGTGKSGRPTKLQEFLAKF